MTPGLGCRTEPAKKENACVGQTREFTESLVTMGKLGSDAAAGIGEVAGPAFKKLGLDANEFIKLRPDEQFFKMFEALNTLGPGLDRTRMIMAAFGEDGGKWLLPLLGKAPDELRKMAKGFEISTAEMEKAQRATGAWKSMENSLTKIWRKVSTMMAPFIEWLASAFESVVNFVTPAFNWASRAIDKFTEMAAIFRRAIVGALTEAWDWIKNTLSGLFDWVGELPTIEKVITEVFRFIGIAAATCWDIIKLGAGAIAYAAGAIVKGFALAVGGFKEFIDLSKHLPESARPTWLKEMSEGVAKLRNGTNAVGEDMMNWGKGAMTNWGNSVKQFDEWFKKATTKTPVAAAQAGGPRLDSQFMVADPYKLGGAFLKGSTEAYSAVVKNAYGIEGDKVANKQLKEQEKIRKNTEGSDKTLKKIGNAVDKIGKF